MAGPFVLRQRQLRHLQMAFDPHLQGQRLVGHLAQQGLRDVQRAVRAMAHHAAVGEAGDGLRRGAPTKGHKLVSGGQVTNHRKVLQHAALPRTETVESSRQYRAQAHRESAQRSTSGALIGFEGQQLAQEQWIAAAEFGDDFIRLLPRVPQLRQGHHLGGRQGAQAYRAGHGETSHPATLRPTCEHHQHRQIHQSGHHRREQLDTGVGHMHVLDQQ